MMELYELAEIISQVPVDLRVEVIVREIISEGLLQQDDIHIIPIGPFRRPYSKEIACVLEDTSYIQNDLSSLKIFTSREGIADMLPPGVVNQPTMDMAERTAEVMVRDAELRGKEFQHARTFFQPIDIEFGRQRVSLEQFEHQSISNPFLQFGEELYNYLWPQLTFNLSPQQKAVLAELTIQAHRLTGDYGAFRDYLEKILDQKFQIVGVIDTCTLDDQIDGLSSLGDGSLGVNWIPFGRLPKTDGVKIIVGPVPTNDIIHFRQHAPIGKNYKILTFLCELLLPVEISWNMVLIPSEGDFLVNTGQETGVLGYTTVLGH